METDFYEDDEDPQQIRAAFDRGPHGATGSSGGVILCGNGSANGGIIPPDPELVRLRAENADLRRQLHDARDLVARSGYFQDDKDLHQPPEAPGGAA